MMKQPKHTSAVEDDVETPLEVGEVVPESVQIEAILDVAPVHLAQHTLCSFSNTWANKNILKKKNVWLSISSKCQLDL